MSYENEQVKKDKETKITTPPSVKVPYKDRFIPDKNASGGKIDRSVRGGICRR